MPLRRLAALLSFSVLMFVAPGRAAGYDLLLLRQDWAANSAHDPACVNSGCQNKLEYGAFVVRDLVVGMNSGIEKLAGCGGPQFDASQIPQSVQSELQCVLSESQSAWEAVWNLEGRCTSMNVSQYFTLLAASFNIFNANNPLAKAGLSVPTVDRNRLTGTLRRAWGVKPWVACNPNTKHLLYISLCLDPSAAAADVVLPVDCPWDPSAMVPGGAECEGELVLNPGVQPTETCAGYFPSYLAGASQSPAQDELDMPSAGTPAVVVPPGVAAAAPLPDGQPVDSTTGRDPGEEMAKPAPEGTAELGSGDAPVGALEEPETTSEPAATDAPPAADDAMDADALPPAFADWHGQPPWSSLNPGSATVANGAQFLQAMARGLGNITLAGDLAFAPGDFHFQEYSLPINVSGAMWIHAADPARPVVLDWSNVSGLINVYKKSTLVLHGIISTNVGDGEQAIAERTVRVQVVGSPIWPTVTGADGHKVLFLDSFLVVPDAELFQQASLVLVNNSRAVENGDDGSEEGIIYEDFSVVTPSLAMIDLMQLTGLGVGDFSYTAGQALYSLQNTVADISAPPSPAPIPVEESSDGLSAGAIAGIAVGAVVAAGALLAAVLVWWRRRAGTKQVADPGKPGGSSRATLVASMGKVSSDLESFVCGKGVGAPVGALVAADVVLHLGSEDASSQHEATASAGSRRSGGSGDSGGGGKGGKLVYVRQSSGEGSSPGTGHSVLPGGKNPFHSITTLDPSGVGGGSESEDLFLSYIRSRLPGSGDGSPTHGPLSALMLPPVSRQSSLTPSLRRTALSSSESSLWDIPFEQLHLQGKIGEGAFGRVYLGEWHATPVAVKLLLPVAQLQDTGSIAEALTKPSPVLTRLQEEADLMFSLRHPNCVQLMGTCLAPPCLITEYCSRGSLADCLREARRHPNSMGAELSWHRRLAMALDAAKGMLYLHSYQPPIVHRDLKSPNLLVDKDWNVKVADFNLSKILGEDHSASQEVTNPRWLAPEVLQGDQATPPSDVFSFGVVMWEMLTFQLPWCQNFIPINPWQLARMVLGGKRLPVPPSELLPGLEKLPPHLMQAYAELMQRCWETSPADRPTFAEIAAQLRDMVQQLSPHDG